jgi:hypothetical protein
MNERRRPPTPPPRLPTKIVQDKREKETNRRHSKRELDIKRWRQMLEQKEKEGKSNDN